MGSSGASKEKFALITGAASGIGKALASEAAADGCALLLVDRDSSGLEKVKDLLAEKYPDLHIEWLVVDLSDTKSAEMIGEVCKRKGINIDVLVNCAGFGIYGLFHETNRVREEEMIRLHVDTATKLIKKFLPGMIDRGRGGIMNVSSMAGFVPGPLMAVYYATKAYLISLSRSLSAEVKSLGVNVTVLAPGVTLTGFSRTVHGKTATIAKRKGFASTPEKVAKTGWRAMKKGKTVAIPGRVNKFLYTLQRCIPARILVPVIKRSQERIGRSVQ